MTSIVKLPSFLSNLNNRDRWVVNELRKLSYGTTLLDAGAGECRYKPWCRKLIYKSQDFGKYDGQGDRKGMQMGSWDNSKLDIVSDITDIPVEDASFDTVLCTEVLEHIPYPDQAIKEISRILKSGGKLILTAPFQSMTHFAPFHFCTGFNIYWYKKILANNGLEIISSNRNGNYFDCLCQELVRSPLVLKKYSKIGLLSYLLYLATIPTIVLLYLMSKLTNGSDEQMTFGYHILAKKRR
jgi:SAM-dependent methyltransferase